MDRTTRFPLTFFVTFILMLYTLTIPALSERTRSNPYLDLGIFAFEEGDFKTALSHLKRAMLKQPDNPVVFYYLGKTFQKMKRYQEARQYYDQAYRIDPDLDGLLYDRAYFNYLTHQYESALKDFSQVAKATPGNMMASYYAGICAFKTDQHHIALQYFLTTAKTSANARDNSQYYAAVCYLQTGNPSQARSLFSQIVKQTQSKTLKKDAQKWLEYINLNPSLFRPYHLYCNFSMTYDDNVTLTSPQDDTVSDEDDLIMKAFVGGSYNFIQSPSFTMGLGYRHFQSNHVDLGEYNLTSSTGEFYVTYHRQNTTQSLYLTPEHYWLDNKNYMSCQRLMYDVQWQRSKLFKLMANFEFAINDHFDNGDYDAQSTSFDIGFEQAMPDNKDISFFSHFRVINNAAKGLDKKYQKGLVRFGLTYQHKELDWVFGGDYSVKQYMHINPSFEKRRNDKLLSFHTSISVKNFSIQPVFKIEHMKNSSGIDDFDYRKTAISFSLRYLY